MKNSKYILLSILLLGWYSSFAQPGKKPAPKEKPPTQKEMEDMMKEMQAAMNDISPEDKKAMDSLGIKMPDIKSIQKNVAGISDAQLKKAFDDENRIVPVKDAARINTAMATTLSNADVNAYISKTHVAVLAKLSATTKTKALEILQQANKLRSSVANTAVGLWIDGKPTLALYLMGEACKADPSNAINLNNYAAFLTMSGAEHLALPILVNLNKRYPKNSSVLNNITQAWLGLGDIAKAEKYADSTIRIYAYHPQANMAKCLIEESKGNIPAAIEAAKKAISKSFSTEKENKLKKLGYELKDKDIDWDRPMPQDPMGLGRFKWPEAPLDVEQNKALELEWKMFKLDCDGELAKLKVKQQQAEEVFQKVNAERMAYILREGQNGHYVQLIPGYAAKAIKKLGPKVNDVNGNMSFVFVQALEPVTRAMANVAGYEKILQEKQMAIDKKYEDKIGEGRSNPLEAICKEENEARSEFLKSANGGIQGAYKGYLDYVARRTSDLLYYYQYTMWPEQFELAKINAQVTWLTTIKDQRVFFKDKSSWCVPKQNKKEKKDTLQQFDDVHCDYVSTMNLGVYKITSSCSNLVGEFNFGGVEINLKDNVETGRFSGSAIVGVSKGIDGPMGSEIEATAAGLVEWDNSGITDWGAIVSAVANAGGQTIAGADVKITVNSGVSTNGKTILQGPNK
jgi:Tfp pilus assembly protein PilF